MRLGRRVNNDSIVGIRQFWIPNTEMLVRIGNRGEEIEHKTKARSS